VIGVTRLQPGLDRPSAGAEGSPHPRQRRRPLRVRGV